MSDHRSLNYRKAIKESAQHLLWLERHQSKALLRDRMRFLRLLKSKVCISQAQAGKAIGLGLRGAEKLWKKYSVEGLEGLLTYPYKGRTPKLDGRQKQKLLHQLSNDQRSTLAQVCQQVEQQSGVQYSIAGMHDVLKQLKVKNKTGRPTYYDKDYKGEKRFKKSSFQH